MRFVGTDRAKGAGEAMINRAGRFALVGTLMAGVPAVASTQEGNAAPAPVIQVPAAPPPSVIVTPPPAPTASAARAATTARSASRVTRNGSHLYTWHGAWRDRHRAAAASRTPARSVPTRSVAVIPPPTPTPTPGFVPAQSSAALTPTPRPVATPTRSRQTPAPIPTVATMSSDALWPWIAAAGLAILLLGGWALASLRRRENGEPTELYDDPVYEPEPEPEHSALPEALAEAEPAHAAAIPAAASPLAVVTGERTADAPPEPVAVRSGRARLAIEFRPLRAGVNLLSATAEGEVTVTNTGAAAAEDIRAEARLISAHAGQDEEIAALCQTPIARPGTPPFALAPGETRQVRLTSALAREAICVLTAADRPMFVPLVVVNVTATTGGLPIRSGQAFAVGVERPGSSKLAPFWLDGPSRMYNSVTAILQGSPLER